MKYYSTSFLWIPITIVKDHKAFSFPIFLSSIKCKLVTWFSMHKNCFRMHQDKLDIWNQLQSNKFSVPAESIILGNTGLWVMDEFHQRIEWSNVWIHEIGSEIYFYILPNITACKANCNSISKDIPSLTVWFKRFRFK